MYSVTLSLGCDSTLGEFEKLKVASMHNVYVYGMTLIAIAWLDAVVVLKPM